MPYFQLESSTSLPEQRYFPVAFIRSALAYQQTGDQKAVMELPPSMDPTKTLTHYKQKISAKKSVLAPAKITLTELTFAEYDAAGLHQSPNPREWTVAAVHLARWRVACHSRRCESSWTRCSKVSCSRSWHSAPRACSHAV